MKNDEGYRRLRRGRSLLAILAAAFALAMATGWMSTTAHAHRAGKAIPRIRVESKPADPSGGLTHEITVTITDADSPSPVSGAEVTVEAEMTVPHHMQTIPISLAEEGTSGVYRGRIRYPMPAQWTLKVSVKGENVQEATAELSVDVSLASAGPDRTSPGEEGGGGVGGERPQVKISGRLAASDAPPVISLAAHATFAAIWAIATIVLVLVAHPRTSRWFAAETRQAVLEKRSRLRLAALAGGVLLVVTGISNGLIAAPFRLTPTASSIKAAMGYPFGSLYLLVLAGKIVVLVALVVANRIPSPAADAQDGDRIHSTAKFALGADLVLFPLLLVLIVLLKYLHVLVHVALAAQ